MIALAIISEHPEISQSDLARELRINRASSMAVASTLEAEGYLSRTPLPGRNRMGLTLTPIGQEKLNEACIIEEELVALTMSNLDRSALTDFVDKLREITRLVNAEPAGTTCPTR